MAQSKDNILIRGLSGTIAKMLTFRQKDGKTIVTKHRRANTGTPSDKALAIQEKFIASSNYAKNAIKDPATKALYKALATDGKTAYNIALADAFQPPKVESMDTSVYRGVVGDLIKVRATDDFKVTGVKLTITSLAGVLIEEGDAVLDELSIDWIYTVKQANAALAGSKITAVASDLPGNNTALEITL